MTYMRHDDKFNYALKNNKGKNYKWSGIGFLGQLRNNKTKCLAAGRALICTEEVNMAICITINIISLNY